MSKAEKYIREHTRNCSNLMQVPTLDDKGNIVQEAHPWLTPENALRAVEIAKEEVIEKVVRHIIFNTRTVHYNNYDTREFNKSSLDDIINDLKQAMKDECDYERGNEAE